MVAYGQMTLTSGNTALYNIKSSIKGGKILAIYIIIALIIGELLALMGIMGIVAELVQEGIRLIQLGEGWFRTFNDVPREAITLTVTAIMNCRSISCVVSGKRKSGPSGTPRFRYQHLLSYMFIYPVKNKKAKILTYRMNRFAFTQNFFHPVVLIQMKKISCSFKR